VERHRRSHRRSWIGDDAVRGSPAIASTAAESIADDQGVAAPRLSGTRTVPIVSTRSTIAFADIVRF